MADTTDLLPRTLGMPIPRAVFLGRRRGTEAIARALRATPGEG